MLLLQAVAAWLPGPWLWGLSHLAYAPGALRVLWPALGLLILWTPAGEAVGRAAVRLLGTLLARPLWAYAIAPLGGMTLFWLLRTPTHFLGDGWLLGELVQRGLPFHGYDFFDYHLHARIFQWLGGETEAQAFQLFALLSVLAGGLYLVFAAWGARRISTRSTDRAAIYGLTVAVAPLQLFCGYVESYAFLAAFLLLAVAGLAAWYAGRAPLAVAGWGFGAALAMHLDALFLAPLLAGALVWPARDAQPAGRRAWQLLGPVAAALAAAIGLMLLGGWSAGWVRFNIVDAHRDAVLRPLLGEMGLFSARHLKDVLNLLLLLTPVGVLLTLTGWRAARERSRDVKLFAAAALWLVLLIIVVRMRLGVARDWDLVAAHAVLFPWTGYLLWRRARPDGLVPGMVGRLLATALLLTAPWLWLNAGAERAVARIEDVSADFARYPRAYVQEEIAKYHRKAGRTEEAEAAYRRCIEIFPANARFHAVLGVLHYHQGELEQAAEVLRAAVAVDSTYIDALLTLAQIHAKWEDYEAALAWTRRYAGRPHETATAAAVHASMAVRCGLPREALDAYRRAAALDPTSAEWLDRAGGLALHLEQWQEAENLFRAAVRRDPQRTSALLGWLVAGRERIRTDPQGCRGPACVQRIRELLGLMAELERRGEGAPQFVQWRSELEAVRARFEGSGAPR